MQCTVGVQGSSGLKLASTPLLSGGASSLSRKQAGSPDLYVGYGAGHGDDSVWGLRMDCILTPCLLTVHGPRVAPAELLGYELRRGLDEGV